jgi:hypothetical protein
LCERHRTEQCERRSRKQFAHHHPLLGFMNST